MPTPYIPIPYRRNPRPLPFQGPRVQDQQSGFWTYANFIVEDEYGTKVDGRYATYDRNKREGEEPI